MERPHPLHLRKRCLISVTPNRPNDHDYRRTLHPLYPTTLGLHERDRRAMIFRHRRIIEKLSRNETSSLATA